MLLLVLLLFLAPTEHNRHRDDHTEFGSCSTTTTASSSTTTTCSVSVGVASFLGVSALGTQKIGRYYSYSTRRSASSFSGNRNRDRNRKNPLLSSSTASLALTTPLLTENSINNRQQQNMAIQQQQQQQRQGQAGRGQASSTSTILFATNKANNNYNEDDGDEDGDDDYEQSSSSSSIPSSPLDRPVLAILDTIMLLVFAAVGKASHSSVDGYGLLDVLLAVAQTAAPFLLSWFLVAPLLGGYTPMATSADWKQSTIATTKAWIVAVPLGCLLRGIVKGYMPPLPFVIVTLIATFVLLVGGRLLYTTAAELYVELF